MPEKNSHSTRARRPITAPEGQGATFVELFFDLVFVFAVTEVTGRVAEDLTLVGVAQAVLVFWMIWWAWTQFTWALNPADTDHGFVRVGTLVATAVAFLMAVSVGDAFEEGGLWFVIPYATVRLLGLALYLWVASERTDQLAAVRIFGALSLLGLSVAIVGGAVDPAWRGWLWLGAVLLDLFAAGIGGRQEGWDLHAAHFAERHGLFVIIVLGESLIAAGVAATDQVRTEALVFVAIGAVAVSCLLWWTYFGWLKDALEEAFAHRQGATQSRLARDAYSLLHFPLIAGVIGMAVGIEEMVAHPAAHMHIEAGIAFTAGLVLFVGSAAAAWGRAAHRLLTARLLLLVVGAGALMLAATASPAWLLAISVVVLAGIVLAEQRVRSRKRVSKSTAG
jgi:low temperature requirement protein LtrA